MFHRRCFNDYFLLVFNFFVFVCLTTGGALGSLGLNLSGIQRIEEEKDKEEADVT